MDKTDVLKMALWSAPKEVNTKFGPRTVSKAKVPAGFWDLWRAQKDALKALGLSVTKNPKTDEWELYWWKEIDDETTAARAESLEMSRATSADVELPHPEGYDYMPFQKAGILYGMARKHVLIGDVPGLGKQQPVDTLVMTPYGWYPIGKLRVGDFVIGSNGNPVEVTGVFPQGVKPAYRVTMSDGSNVEAGPEHLWTVAYNRGGKVWADLTLTTEQLLNRPKLPFSYPGGRDTLLDLSKTPLYLPMLSAPIDFEGSYLPIPAYALGQMIANGGLSGSSVVISVNAADGPEVLRNLEGVILGNQHTYGNVFRLTIIEKMMRNVRALGLNVLSAEKFIPSLYKTASTKDRIALLNGLMDGDGSISKERNRVTYHTCSLRLANDVAELVEGLGGLGTVRHYVRTDGKPDEYQVRVRLPLGIQPFTISRKADRYNPGKNASPCRTIKSVEYVRDVESVCIMVDAPDHLYLTEHCILTHNTIQAIGLINTIADIESAVIVCPKSLKLNWKRELERWLMKDLSIGIVGTQWPNTDIVIMNYESLGKWQEQIKAHGQWGAVVLDEAHLIKSRKAIRSKLSKSIDTRHKIRLTGTPIVNRPIELYNLIEDMGNFGTFFEFARRYAGGAKTRFGWDFSGATNLDELQTRLRSTIMIRRLKEDVLKELPRKIRQIIELEPDDAASKQAVKREQAHEAESDVRLAELRAIVEISKAESEQSYQMAVANLKAASSFDFEEIARIRHETALAKLPQIIAHVEDALEDNDSKIVIAAHHRDIIESFVAHSAEKGWNPVYIMGGLSEQARQDAVDRFMTDPACRVFVASIQAAGVGITLTSASHMVVAELPWTPGELTQVEDRLHRIGQLETVLIQHLVLSGSIDSRMAQLLVEKQKVSDLALDVNHPARTTPVYEGREKSASASLDVQKIQDEAAKITPEEISDILSKLNFLAALDNDHAEHPNGVGFSKVDSAIGHSFAQQGYLTPKQAVIGRQIVKKYHRQLDMKF